MRGEFLDVEGARLYYYAAGSRGVGDPVLFLHGFPTSGHLWNGVVPLMRPGHRLVVLDLLGYGRSDPPLTRRVDVLGHAARVAGILDELRIGRACIVGHGLGGGIAQAIAVHHPDRVSHLGLIDSIALHQWPTPIARLARISLPLLGLVPQKAVLAMLRRRLCHGYSDAARATHALDRYLRPFGGMGGRAALFAQVRALAKRETPRVHDAIRKLDIPTAIVWGQQDPLTPLSTGRRLHDAIRGATLTVIRGARHFTPEEAPRQVADAIALLLER